MLRARSWLLVLVVAAAPSVAHAQAAAADSGAQTGPSAEGPDATRLDVERLPPEAIPITRDLYAHGFLIEGALGARGFVGGIGRFTDPGPYGALRFGYEILDWLFVHAVAELSFHQTNAPPPPGTEAFELFFGLAEVRLQTHPTAEFAMWASGQAGLGMATTDALALYGFQDFGEPGFAYGAEAGLDWHFRSRHFSLGVLGGVRLGTSLDGRGETSLGAHGAIYLRNVL